MKETKEKVEKFDIATIGDMDPVVVFTGDYLDEQTRLGRELLEAHKPDLMTKKGRDAIKKFSGQYTTVKCRVDDAGKNLGASLRDELGKINSKRGTFVSDWQEMQDKARQPLTDWENEEKALNAANELAAKVADDHDEALTMNDIVNREIELAKKELAVALAEEERLARLAEALAEKLRTERDAEVKRNAEENARQKAEEAISKAEVEKQQAIEQAKREKREAEINAEIEKRETKEREERAKIQAEVEKEQAIEDERKRVADKLESERLETERRASDVANKKKINNAALAALCGIVKEAEAKKIISAIAKGEVPHITITY